jgi:alpha-tubulin suppressor-like RCC1 family protein
MQNKNIILSSLVTILLLSGCQNEIDELKVTKTVPTNNTQIEKNANIEIYFDDILKNDLNLTNSVLLMDSSGNVIKTSKTISNTKIIIDPIEELKLNTNYSVYLSSGLTNIYDGTLPEDYRFYFNIKDNLAPIISNIYPLDNSIDIENDIVLKVTYDENIDVESVNNDNVYLLDNLGNKIDISISVAYNTIQIKPINLLNSNTSYILNIKRYIKDINGNYTNESYSSKFEVSDSLKPIILETNIDNNTSIDKNSSIDIKFSEPLNTDNLSDKFYLRDATNLVLIPISINYSSIDNKVTLSPLSDLLSLNTYLLEISDKNIDTSGNKLENTIYYNFTTNDTTAPVINKIIPDNLSSSIKVDTDIKVYFNEEIDTSSIISNNILIGDGTIFYNTINTFDITTNILTIKPSIPLSGLTNYTITISSLKDLYGNVLSDYSSTFTTSENVAPILLNITPANDEIGIKYDTQILMDFNEVLNIDTVTAANIQLISQTTEIIPTDIYYFDKRIIIKPISILKTNEKYTVNINGVTDLNDNPIINLKSNFYTTSNLSSSSSSLSLVSKNNIGYVSGRNDEGQLGLGDKIDRNIPTILPGKWQKIEICARHSVGLSIDGTVWAWGSYRYGKRGEGTSTNTSDGTMNQIGTKSDWVDVNCNVDATYLKNKDNELYSFGLNNYFQLSNGNNTNQYFPVLSETDVLKVNAYGNTLCLIKTDFKMYCIGYNNNAQAGVNNGNGTAAVLTNIDSDLYYDIADASYYYNGMGINQNNDIKSWGYNNYNQRGTAGDVRNPFSTQISTTVKFKKVCSGDRHTMGLTVTGDLYTLGTNSYSAMINNSIGLFTKVLAIDGIIIPKIADISCNWYGTSVMDESGVFWVWGRNNSGQRAGATAVGTDVTIATKLVTD